MYIKRGLMSDKNQKEITTLSGFKQALLACKGQHVSIVSTLASGVKKIHLLQNENALLIEEDVLGGMSTVYKIDRTSGAYLDSFEFENETKNT